MPMLELWNVQTYYGNIMALKGITLLVNEGEIITLIGANGAGKSTTLMTVCGIVPPRSGEILFMGKPIQHVEPHEIVAMGISQVPEGRRIFPLLTVTENLDMGAFLRKDKAEILRDIEYIFTLFPILKERRHQPGGTLSGGEQQMLAIGRGLMARPRLLIMDEPTLGLSPMMRKEVGHVTKKINLSGTSIIFVEQDAQMALRISHKGIVLQNGQVAMQGSSQELLSNPTLKESYLS